MMGKHLRVLIVLFVALIGWWSASAQSQTKWTPHDRNRPAPPFSTPGQLVRRAPSVNLLKMPWCFLMAKIFPNGRKRTAPSRNGKWRMATSKSSLRRATSTRASRWAIANCMLNLPSRRLPLEKIKIEATAASS